MFADIDVSPALLLMNCRGVETAVYCVINTISEGQFEKDSVKEKYI